MNDWNWWFITAYCSGLKTITASQHINPSSVHDHFTWPWRHSQLRAALTLHCTRSNAKILVYGVLSLLCHDHVKWSCTDDGLRCSCEIGAPCNPACGPRRPPFNTTYGLFEYSWILTASRDCKWHVLCRYELCTFVDYVCWGDSLKDFHRCQIDVWFEIETSEMEFTDLFYTVEIKANQIVFDCKKQWWCLIQRLWMNNSINLRCDCDMHHIPTLQSCCIISCNMIIPQIRSVKIFNQYWNFRRTKIYWFKSIWDWNSHHRLLENIFLKSVFSK